VYFLYTCQFIWTWSFADGMLQTDFFNVMAGALPLN
jgi:hypothetical protein